MSGAKLSVGIEIHARIRAQTKLFSRAGAWAKDPLTGRPPGPNTLVGLLDCSLPGAMPVLNQTCVDQAIATGIALSGNVQPQSIFERKHYFYCDSPLGYQITQQGHPIVVGGHVELGADQPDAKKTHKVRISRIQLEQDTAKSFHFAHGTLVDLNRAGAALMEIVSEPDMTTSKQSSEYVKTVQALLRHIGTCDGNMEDGSLRADINVSIELPDGRKSHRVEIKNLNSLRSIERAVAYEEKRLAKELLERNESELNTTNKSETRTFDVKTGETIVLREKETKVDYRFMPEPDLPPLLITKERIERVKHSMNELPWQTRKRLGPDGYGLRPAEVNLLMDNASLLRSFEMTCKAAGQRAPSTLVANLLCNTVLGALRKEQGDVDVDNAIDPEQLAELCARVHVGDVSSQQAKDLVADYIVKRISIVDWPANNNKSNEKPDSVGNNSDLLDVCTEVVRSHPKEAAQYQGGKHTVINFFFGKAMAQFKKAGRTPDVDQLRETLKVALQHKK